MTDKPDGKRWGWNTIYVVIPGDRPDFRLVIAFLWNDEQNVDTDGDAHSPASRTWTELYIQNREQEDQIVDVSPHHQGTPLILQVESTQRELGARVALFLATFCGGRVSHSPDGEYRPADSLREAVGAAFDLSAAFERVAKSPFIRSTLEAPYPNRDRQ